MARPNYVVVRNIFKAVGIASSIGTGAYCVWRELITQEARGDCDDDSFKWRLLYGYCVIFCIVLCIAELEFLPKAWLTHFKFLQGPAGRGAGYIFIGSLLFKYILGYFIGVFLMVLGLANMVFKSYMRPQAFYLDPNMTPEEQLRAIAVQRGENPDDVPRLAEPSNEGTFTNSVYSPPAVPVSAPQPAADPTSQANPFAYA